MGAYGHGRYSPGGCLFSADIARPKSRISNHVMADFGIDFGIFGGKRKEGKQPVRKYELEDRSTKARSGAIFPLARRATG